MPPRGLESAVEKTRAAAQLVRDQFGMARADDASTDASTPGTRRGRRGVRRRRSRSSGGGDPVTAQERADEASAPDSPATPDRPRKRAAASKRDAQPRAGSPRRRLASRGEQGGEQSADQAATDTSAGTGGDGDNGGGGGVLSRAREAAGTARQRASEVVSRGASRLRGQSSPAAASAGPAVGGEGETVDSRNEAAVALDEQLDTDRRITSDDVAKDGDVYRLKDEVAREIAAKDAADRLDEQFDTDIAPDDVTVERQGDEYVVADVRTSTRADVVEEETAEGQPFSPEDVSAVLTGTGEDGPEFDVELSPRARRRLINERVEEQGGIETKDGELIEADPEDLRFDSQGRVVGINRDEQGADGGGLVNAATSPPALAGLAADAIGDAAAQGGAVGTFGLLSFNVDNEAQSRFSDAVGSEIVAGPARLPSDAASAAETAVGGLSFAFESVQEEGVVEGAQTTADAAADESGDIVNNIAAAAEERPLTTAGILAAPSPAPRGTGLARVERAEDAATTGGRAGDLTGGQRAALGGLAASGLATAAVTQGEIEVPDGPLPGISQPEIGAPESGDPSVRSPEVQPPESGDPTVQGSEIAAPVSGDATVTASELSVPDSGDPSAQPAEIPVPDQSVGGGVLSTQALIGEQDGSGDVLSSIRRRQRERQRRRERRELLEGPDDAVLGELGGGGVSQRPAPRRDTVADTGVVDAGVIGAGTAGASSETATPGLESPTESGSEVFDAAFGGFGSGDAPAGAEAALGLLEEAQSPDAQTGLEIAQTPATETATAAGLSLGQDLSLETVQAPATDAESAADTAGQQALIAEQTAQSRGLAAPAQATANPAETSPGFPGQPAYPNEPGFGEEVVAQPVEQGPPRRGARDDDDDDDEVVGLFGAGEAATPFANPVVGGPEAFGVAGGSLVTSDDDDDSPGLGLGVP